MHNTYIDTVEKIISDMSRAFKSPSESDLHLEDFRQIWLFNEDVVNHIVQISKNRNCQLLLSGQLKALPSPSRRIRRILSGPLQSAQSWELNVSSQIFCPSAFYCRFATIGKGRRNDTLYTGLFKIDGSLYELWHKEESGHISGKLHVDIERYQELWGHV